MARRRPDLHRALLLWIGLVLLVGALAVPLRASSGDDGSGAAWDRIDDIEYLLPTRLPEGWVVSTATLRPGRPREQWSFRADVFADTTRRNYVVVGATIVPGRPSTSGRATPLGPATEVEVDDLLYVVAYLGLEVEDGWRARQITWGSGAAGLSVTQLGADPTDDELLQRIAEQHTDAVDLDYPVPAALAEAGYTPVGTLVDTRDVADYTVVWTDQRFAGRDRASAADAREGAPRLSINVGSPMFVPLLAHGGSLPTDPAAADVREDDGRLELVFLREGVPVTVQGRGVEPEALRAMASSLESHPLDDWMERLGDRLLVDEPEER